MVGLEPGARLDAALYAGNTIGKAKKRKAGEEGGGDEDGGGEEGGKRGASAGPVYYNVCVRDNGRGMAHEDIPQMLAVVLSGTKYGVRQARGKFGLGAKMALIWAKQTTGHWRAPLRARALLASLRGGHSPLQPTARKVFARIIKGGACHTKWRHFACARRTTSPPQLRCGHAVRRGARAPKVRVALVGRRAEAEQDIEDVARESVVRVEFGRHQPVHKEPVCDRVCGPRFAPG